MLFPNHFIQSNHFEVIEMQRQEQRGIEFPVEMHEINFMLITKEEKQ